MKWKIDYAKYKPLTSAARCNDCGQKNITKAYRQLCDNCCQKKTPTALSKEDGTPLNFNLVANDTDLNLDLYEIKELKRCSKCANPTLTYAHKVIEDTTKVINDLNEDEYQKMEKILEGYKER